MARIIALDGAQGEGGGQILRSALSLSMITGQPFEMSGIRAGRAKPGLLRQHLTAVRAATEICGAQVNGDELGSQQLRFTPGPIRGGEYRFAIGSAGSCMLVLQTVLPALWFADGSSRVVVARTHNLPLIVDAAAEEDLQCYYRVGADLVIYSGAKAIEGPTSGLVIGKTQYVEWVKRQSAGIGRAMKVGKEGIVGLTCAIELYLRAQKESGAEMVEKMAPFIDTLNTFNGVSARVVWDSAGRDIARTEIKFDEAVTGIATGELVDALKQGEYAIYFRGYKANEGIIEADVRSVDRAQLAIVARRIGEVINQEKQA